MQRTRAVGFVLAGRELAAFKRFNLRLPHTKQIVFPTLRTLSIWLTRKLWVSHGVSGDWIDEEGPREIIEIEIRRLVQSKVVSADEIGQVLVQSWTMITMLLINGVITSEQLDTLTYSKESPMVISGITFSYPEKHPPRALSLIIDPDPAAHAYFTLCRKDGSAIQE